MSHPLVTTNKTDLGHACLARVLRYHGLAAAPEQIRRRFWASDLLGPTTVLCGAPELGLRAKVRKSDLSPLARYKEDSLKER